jgi:multidrug efflux pump subunit AcrA (membrane-fusion protein)
VVALAGAGALVHHQERPGDNGTAALPGGPGTAPADEGKVAVTGALEPVQRRWVYPPAAGTVVAFAVHPGDAVAGDQKLVRLHDPELEHQALELRTEVEAAERQIQRLDQQLAQAPPGDVPRLRLERAGQVSVRDAKKRSYDALLRRTNGEADNPGFFWVNAPALPREPDARWTVLSQDFRAKLTGRYVPPTEPLLLLAVVSGPWEAAVKIPQEQVGLLLRAFERDNPRAELDVELTLRHAPGRVYGGKLARHKIAPEPEPAGLSAWVRLDGPGIPEDRRVPRELLLAGAEVDGKVLCGDQGR